MAEIQIYPATDPNSNVQNNLTQGTSAPLNKQPEVDDAIRAILKFAYTIEETNAKLLEPIKKRLKLSEKRLELSEKKAENIKASIVKTLGIFVAFFTFISVEFQFFKYLTHFSQFVALTFILIGSLFLFVILLYVTTRDTENRIFSTKLTVIFRPPYSMIELLIGLSIALLMLGLILTLISPPNTNNTEIDTPTKRVEISI